MTSEPAATSFDAVATGTDIQRRIGTKTSRDEPLARFTTMRVGGPADLFVVAHNRMELRALIRFAHARALPFQLLGRGSDIVISDRGVRGIVIQLQGGAYHTVYPFEIARKDVLYPIPKWSERK